MKAPKTNPAVPPPRFRAAVRRALGLVLLAAGAMKAAAPAEFHTHLLGYALGGPDTAYRTAAVIFPWVEAICGGLLLAGRWLETAGALAAALGLLFVLALGQAWLRGLDFNCGCLGGVGPEWLEQPPAAFARAVLMLAAALWTWFPPRRRAA